MKKPLISIITVVLNDSKNIEKTICSVINQSFRNIEYIIIDGKSTDGTQEIIQKYSSKIDICVCEKDRGIYDAMNKGIKFARGEYILFLNSGDFFVSKSSLEKIKDYLDNNLDLICARVIKLYKDFDVVLSNNFNHIKLGIMPGHQACFMKRRVLNELKRFNSSYISSGDFDLFCRFYISKNYTFKSIDLQITKMPSGGVSSIKEIGYVETSEIIEKHFGKYYFLRFYFLRIVLEQQLKKILIYLKLKKCYDTLLKIKIKLCKF